MKDGLPGPTRSGIVCLLIACVALMVTTPMQGAEARANAAPQVEIAPDGSSGGGYQNVSGVLFVPPKPGEVLQAPAGPRVERDKDRTKEQDKSAVNACAAALRAGNQSLAQFYCTQPPATKMEVRPSADERQMLLRPSVVPPGPIASGVSFQTGTKTQYSPPDPNIAAGPSNLVVVNNETIRVFSKAGTLLNDYAFWTFFGDSITIPADDITDPRVHYDEYINRFWITATVVHFSPNSNKLVVALSDSSDATGTWTKFIGMDGTVDANTPTGNFCDFPQLGLDATAIYITCNQFSFSSGSFQYAKIRVMSKGQFLNNTCCFWWDFFDLQDQSGGNLKSKTIQPAHMRGAVAADGEFLVNAEGQGNSGSGLSVRRITNAANCCIPLNQSAPTLQRVRQAVASYTIPPDANQLGSGLLVSTNFADLVHAVWKSGRLMTGQNTGCHTGADSCASFTEIDVSAYPTTSVVNDWILGTNGLDYYYPAVDVNSANNKTMVYSRSGSTQYPGTYFVGIPPSSDCTGCFISPEVTLRAGLGPFTSGSVRWGDYLGASTDPDGTGIWVVGEFATSGSLIWGVQAGLTQETTVGGGGNPVPSISNLNPNSTPAGSGGFTLTVNGAGFINASVVRWNGSDRTTTFVNSGQLMASISSGDVAAQGTAQVTVFNPTPGGGASNASTFTIGAPVVNPLPQLAALSPGAAAQGSGTFTMTVYGARFVFGSTVQVNGSNRTTTFVNSGQLTASIPSSDLTSAGTLNITVFNPPLGGGSSGTVPFLVGTAATPNASYAPHMVGGSGILTKLSVMNMSLNANLVSLDYRQQGGAPAAGATTAMIAPAGVLRLQYSGAATQWLQLFSQFPVAINSFFELNLTVPCASLGAALPTTVGFNNQAALADFTIPVEFAPTGTNCAIGRTVGVAFANPNGSIASVTLRLVDVSGQVVATHNFNLPAFGQQALDLNLQVPVFQPYTTTNFIGTLAVQSSLPISALALGDAYGPFFATPPIVGRVR